MDNKMDKVADILGVRLNEIFHIVGHGNKQYLLSKFGYLCKVEEGGIELPVDDDVPVVSNISADYSAGGTVNANLSEISHSHITKYS